MTIVSGGKVFERCGQCGKLVQMNKVIGSLHVCVSNCDKAGAHLDVREEVRGKLWKRTWRVCGACGIERKMPR